MFVTYVLTLICVTWAGSGSTGVAAFSGQIEANRGSGRIFDYGFTTSPGSEIINDFLLFFRGSHRYGLLNPPHRGKCVLLRK